MSIGVAGGKRVYFGTAKNDAWIEATTGHMWLKGSITVKNYAHFFAEKQRLRVGAAWGMPGLYASDGGDRDMVLGTAAGKKVPPCFCTLLAACPRTDSFCIADLFRCTPPRRLD